MDLNQFVPKHRFTQHLPPPPPAKLCSRQPNVTQVVNSIEKSFNLFQIVTIHIPLTGSKVFYTEYKSHVLVFTHYYLIWVSVYQDHSHDRQRIASMKIPATHCDSAPFFTRDVNFFQIPKQEQSDARRTQFVAQKRWKKCPVQMVLKWIVAVFLQTRITTSVVSKFVPWFVVHV